MKTLNEKELVLVSGGDTKEAGRAVGNAVQEAGKKLTEVAEELIEAWLPIAKKINSIIR